MGSRAAVLAACLVLVFAASAQAWTAGHSAGDSVYYGAAAGETNTVVFGYTTITDSTAIFDPTPPESCTQGADEHTANCNWTVSYASISLGDGNDKLTIVGGSTGFDQEVTHIYGGPGQDDGTGGAKDEIYSIDDGEGGHINGAPPGADGNDIVEADDNDIVADNCDVVNYPPPRPPVSVMATKTADTFDGWCDADCSLREAV